MGFFAPQLLMSGRLTTTFNKALPLLIVGCTLLVCYFTLGHHLGSRTIELWDESRNVANTLEMLDNGNLITRHFNGKPDMWELKPPFVIWCQALSVKILGYTEFAIRFPSLFFSMSTLLLLFGMSRKITGQLWAGALSSVILASSIGYVGEHVARSGDHDVILCFFTTSLLFSFYLFLELRSLKYLILTCISLLFVWLTKSIAGLVFLPSLIAWAAFDKKLFSLFKDRWIWAGLALCLLLAGFYYFVREQQSPGYIRALWNEELFGRYTGAKQNSDNTGHGFGYYLQGMATLRFSFFLIPLALLALVVIVFRKFPQRRLMLFLLLQWTWFLIVISGGAKNFWYDAPLYPIAAFFIGLGTCLLISKIKHKSLIVIAALTLFGMLWLPFTETLEYTSRKQNPANEINNLCHYLRYKKFPPDSHLKVLPSAFETPLFLYLKQQKKQQVEVQICTPSQLKSNDTLLIGKQALKDSIALNFNLVQLDSWQGSKLYLCSDLPKK